MFVYFAPHTTSSAFCGKRAALGDNDAAIAHCREAIAMRDPQFVIFARGWPNSDALRALPEHRAMLVEIGLPGTGSPSPKGA